MVYLELFISFFKIGAFTIGGGYAMLPLIQREVVERKKWIEKEEFLDMLAVAQSAPGAIAINTAVFTGYKIAGVPGAIFTTLGSALPSFIIILLVATIFVGIRNNPVVERIFKGIRPAVVALIAVPVFSIGRDAKINMSNIIIPIGVTILIAFLKISPIYIIILAALCGIIFYKIKSNKGNYREGK